MERRSAADGATDVQRAVQEARQLRAEAHAQRAYAAESLRDAQCSAREDRQRRIRLRALLARYELLVEAHEHGTVAPSTSDTVQAIAALRRRLQDDEG